jgi:hypothetical protein
LIGLSALICFASIAVAMTAGNPRGATAGAGQAAQAQALVSADGHPGAHSNRSAALRRTGDGGDGDGPAGHGDGRGR